MDTIMRMPGMHAQRLSASLSGGRRGTSHVSAGNPVMLTISVNDHSGHSWEHREGGCVGSLLDLEPPFSPVFRPWAGKHTISHLILQTSELRLNYVIGIVGSAAYRLHITGFAISLSTCDISQYLFLCQYVSTNLSYWFCFLWEPQYIMTFIYAED